jgi:hypothetical protein
MQFDDVAINGEVKYAKDVCFGLYEIEINKDQIKSFEKFC